MDRLARRNLKNITVADVFTEQAAYNSPLDLSSVAKTGEHLRAYLKTTAAIIWSACFYRLPFMDIIGPTAGIMPG